MPRPSFEREGIEAEIDRVRSLGVDSLRTLWRTTFRSSPPPAFSKDILARFLCWHIQDQAFGGLDPKTAKHLGSAQVAIAPLRYLAEDCAVSGRDLLGYQTEPGAE